LPALTTFVVNLWSAPSVSSADTVVSSFSVEAGVYVVAVPAEYTGLPREASYT
jgi:hypothetical protein